MIQRRCRFLVLIAFSIALLSLTVAAQPLDSPSEKPALPEGGHKQAHFAISSIPPGVRLKIEPQLLKEFLGTPSTAGPAKAFSAASGIQRTFLVHLRERADLHPVMLMGDKQERRQATITRLQETARRTQGPVLSYLAARSAEGKVTDIESYWIFNGLAVTADLGTLLELAARLDVEMIRANHVRRIEPLPRSGAAWSRTWSGTSR